MLLVRSHGANVSRGCFLAWQISNVRVFQSVRLVFQDPVQSGGVMWRRRFYVVVEVHVHVLCIFVQRADALRPMLERSARIGTDVRRDIAVQTNVRKCRGSQGIERAESRIGMTELSSTM